MQNSLLKYINYRHFIYFFSFVTGWPCVFFLMGWLPHYTVNYFLLLVLAGVYVLVKGKFSLPVPIFCLLIFQILFWCAYSWVHDFDTSYFTRVFLLCVTWLILLMQMNPSRRYEFTKTYNLWLTVQAVAGTIGFVLVLIGVLRPLFEFTEMDGRPGYFFGLFTTNTFLYGFVRNAGFFDEPGALAFWGIFALVINKLFINNRKVEILLIFGLISTLSMAYFIQLAMYFIFFYGKKFWKYIPYVLVFLIALGVLSSMDESLHYAIFGRFEYDETTGTLEGNNRSELMRRCWEYFKSSPIVGIGAEKLIEKSSVTHTFAGANAAVNLAVDGLLGQLVILSPYFFLLYLSKYDLRYAGAFLIFIAGFLQRPYDCTQLLYPLLTFTIILLAYLKTQEKRPKPYESKTK